MPMTTHWEVDVHLEFIVIENFDIITAGMGNALSTDGGFCTGSFRSLRTSGKIISTGSASNHITTQKELKSVLLTVRVSAQREKNPPFSHQLNAQENQNDNANTKISNKNLGIFLERAIDTLAIVHYTSSLFPSCHL
ncbi:hypothetical protein ACJX0J_002637, partial [Zea mays]